jgi:hypothetical protein
MGGSYIHRLTNKYDPNIRQLTNEYRNFFTIAYFGSLPEWGASKSGRIYNILHI